MTTPVVGKPIPEKLKRDAIVEALLEIRFDSPPVPEIMFGRLADYAPWANFKQRRLPAYQLSAAIRNADPNLRFSPVFELSGPNRIVRVGPQVLSFHMKAPYVGWAAFRPELADAVDGLFLKAGAPVNVGRIGLRYLNALKPEEHGVRAITDLDLKISVAGDSAPININLNFATDVAEDARCTVRIASSEFIRGMVPERTAVMIDVDVFTKPSFRTNSSQRVKEWIDMAHLKEKEQFFRLLTQTTIADLRSA